ncbi:glutamine--fructose-6-phosphate transaminase (isomerizing) [bacterium]|nr:glutamine--fructose-6-phosphate transaminase (isomerizing) [bacterium]
MCGIFGYVGSSEKGPQLVQEGLQRLEYRGYDSWGVGALAGGSINVYKKTGIVFREALPLPVANRAVGHTRWATHGAVTDANAHPHMASDNSFILCHNGIVENADALKQKLQKYAFVSQTDTEVIVHLVEEYAKKVSLQEAVRRAFKELAGRNTVIVLSRSGDVYAVRNGSPLVVGTNKRGEYFFSSDSLSLGSHAENILVVENGQMVVCSNDALALSVVATGKKATQKWEAYRAPSTVADKGSYPHYMIKEIHDSAAAVLEVLKDKTNFAPLVSAIKKARTVYCIGSGTAGVAAQQIAFYLRSIAGVRAVHLIGGEASEYADLIGKSDLCIAPSQSGETADVLEVLEKAQKRGAKIASYVNMYGSMMTRMSDFPFMANAGPEICVMSTKIFTSQIAWGYMLAHRVAGTASRGIRDIRALVTGMYRYLADTDSQKQIQEFAKEAAQMPHLFLMAKGQNAAIIREGMVKIIEGSYVHAHAIPSGDLKHYAITLMEKGTPVIALVSDDDVRTDVENAVHEVTARGARVVTIGAEDDALLRVPRVGGAAGAVLNVLPLQLLAYHMAVARGNNVDKPRNIAKSVTVK